MHPADYWKTEKNQIRCSLCQRKCLIPDKTFGFCGTRQNKNQKLYSIVYSRPVAINIDPIEKKPFYHFNPGSKVLSFGTMGCNMRCKYCCNYQISQARMDELKIPEISPAELVRLAKEKKCQGIAYTYTEPTVFFEYARDTARLAKKAGLFNVFVTNGYITSEPVKDIAPYLDAVVINFKGFNSKFYREQTSSELSKVKQGALNYKKHSNAHIEISYLVVPGLSDSIPEFKKFVNWVAANFGKKTPLHILRFFPSYLMPDKESTSPILIEKFYETAKSLAMEHVYPGNLNHKFNNTFCSNCRTLLIERESFQLVNCYLDQNKRCPKCKKQVNVSGSCYV